MAGQPVSISNLADLIDGLTNPTEPVIVAGGPVQTYPADRSSVYRTLLSQTTPGTTTARNAAGTNSVPYMNLLSKSDMAVFTCNLTSAATEAGDTLDVYVDLSEDGQTWFNGIHYTQFLGNGGAKILVAMLCHPTAAVNPIDVTADAAVTVSRNLWAPHVRVGWANADANANTNAIFSFSVTVYLQAM